MFIVGIKRRFWFGFAKYKVKTFFLRGFTKLHDAQGIEFDGPITPYLVLKLENGKEHYIGNIEQRDWFSQEVK